MAKKRQFVKSNDFDKIKELGSYDISIVKIAKTTGWSVMTVTKVLRCENFGEYVKKNETLSQYVKDRRIKSLEEARQLKDEWQSKAKQEETVEVIPAEVVEAVEKEDQLARIADALERLVEVVDKRRTLF